MVLLIHLMLDFYLKLTVLVTINIILQNERIIKIFIITSNYSDIAILNKNKVLCILLKYTLSH